MANDLFGGLGGLMKGLSGFMPKDDPATKMITAQTEVSELESKETELYAAIGRRAMETDPGRYGEYGEQLRLVQANLAAAKAQLSALKEEQEAAQRAKQEQDEKCTCPECGTRNPDGVKFCQECGTKLGAPTKCFCGSCGAENAKGTRFCGECGAKISQ